jgi:hypothetical protein
MPYAIISYFFKSQLQIYNVILNKNQFIKKIKFTKIFSLEIGYSNHKSEIVFLHPFINK